MKRLLAPTALAIAVLAGCGNDTCSSNPAQPQNANGGASCTLAPASNATIQVRLCAKCTDSAPTCQAEFVGNRLEVAPVVQQCQENSGCAISGCNSQVPTATCNVTLPASATAGQSYDLVVVGDTGLITNTLTISSSGGTSCTL